MNLLFTEEQELYRKQAKKWLDENVPKIWDPFYKDLSEEEIAQKKKQWERILYKGGYSGISWPKEYGGQGLSLVEELIFNEELGKLDVPEGINLIGKSLLGPTILAVGTEEQKKRFIPKLVSGEEIWCQGFSEPNAGSDLAALSTKAELINDKWVINGQKVWTSFAQYADWCFVLARTNKDAKKHQGITFFLVPMDSDGITVRQIKELTGGQQFSEVFFDNVEIPKDHYVGEVDKGWEVSMTTLSHERGTHPLGKQARFHNELQNLIQLSKELERNGDILAKQSYFRQKIAQSYIENRIMYYLCLKNASEVINKGKIGPEASILKLYWSEMHQRFAKFSLEILQDSVSVLENGSSKIGEFQKIYLESRKDTIVAGSSQIQRNIISERILEMPR